MYKLVIEHLSVYNFALLHNLSLSIIFNQMIDILFATKVARMSAEL